MRYAVLVTCSLAMLTPGVPSALAQQEGGGVGGSLVAPETSSRRVQPGPGSTAKPRKIDPQAPVGQSVGSAPAIYSYPINTQPDGWAALKAEPRGDAQRLTKVQDGTLFLVVGRVPGWKLVQLESGERGWIAERLVGCCLPPRR